MKRGGIGETKKNRKVEGIIVMIIRCNDDDSDE